MVAAVEFPPSARDFDVHRRIIVYDYSTRQVAGEHHLSQTRVRQLADRVGRWLAEVLPTDEVPEEAGLCLARQLAADRLDFFYTQAMHGWHVGANPRSLSLALRIVMAQSRLPSLPGRIEALAADVTEGPLPDYRDPGQREVDSPAPQKSRAKPQPIQSPPADSALAEPNQNGSYSVRDFSAPPQSGPPDADLPAQESSLSHDVERASASLSPRAKAARRAFFGAAQPSFDDDDDSPGAVASHMKLTPEQLGLSVDEVLARHEKRRRRRAKAG